MSYKSFTLIELLVVIAVMGLLASIVLVSLAGARERARWARAQQELDQIRKAIIVAQYKEDKILKEITGSSGSEILCRNIGDLNILVDTHPCIVNLINAFNTIGLPLMRDPWGSPYLIDENELDPYPFGNGPYCRHDTVNSAGSNRIYTGGPAGGPPCSNYHDEEATPCDDDGPRVKVPFYKCVTPDIFCPVRCPQ